MQVSNLLYRRFPIGKALACPNAPNVPAAPIPPLLRPIACSLSTACNDPVAFRRFPSLQQMARNFSLKPYFNSRIVSRLVPACPTLSRKKIIFLHRPCGSTPCRSTRLFRPVVAMRVNHPNLRKIRPE
jgi:hypothetical protein